MLGPDAETCYCGDDTYWCNIHVGCDQLCKALAEPDENDHAEVLKAYLHWSSHSLWSGCSHGN